MIPPTSEVCDVHFDKRRPPPTYKQMKKSKQYPEHSFKEMMDNELAKSNNKND